MSNWLDRRVRDVRMRLTPQDKDSLWLLLLEDRRGEVLVASAITEAMLHLDRGMVRNIGRIIRMVPSPAVLLVVPRVDGLPRAVDKELWLELKSAQCADTELVDLVVVGDADYWSARQAS
jgi:hypothetical protein